MMMTKVDIDLWVLVAGVALPSFCLLMISLAYCWRRLTRRRGKAAEARDGADGFNQQVLLEMVLQQTDNALNSIVDAVQIQRTEMLKVLESHQLSLPTADIPGTDRQGVGAPPEISAPAAGEACQPAGGAEDGSRSATAASQNQFKTSPTAALFDPYSQIPDHIHQGLSVSEVASRLDLPEAAVDLYVNLRMSGAKTDSQKSA